MRLSKEQEKAAHSESKRLLLIAGAGSGKTRTMIARMVYLIQEKNVSPYELAVLTFTRRAAGEIKERLIKEIGSKAAKITAGTIHSVALNYLQRFGELVGLKPGKITVYSPWEEEFLLKEVAKEMGFHNGKTWKGVKKYQIDGAFYLYYTSGILIKDNDKALEIMTAFFQRCKENNALTYGTILTEFKRLIPLIGQFMGLRHVLCDEVQDNDPLQWSILNDICKACNASLFAVGDPRQSIYSFRGADPAYLTRNKHLFDIYNLKDNYRSSANIVEAANNLIGHNGGELGEPMRAIRERSSNIRIENNMDSENIKIFIDSYKDFGILENTAILARNHWLLEKLSRLLTESHIKHEYIGKKTAMTRSEPFRRFHAFLKLIVNPFDNFSFLLIKDYLGLSQSHYSDIRMLSCVEFQSHFETWKAVHVNETYTWQKWFKSSENTDMASVVDWMKDVEFEFGTSDIFDFVYGWMLDNYDGTIEGYLSWLATWDISDEVKEESEGLMLLTGHSAKGLEFPTVILCGLNEGIFPSKQSIGKDQVSDERNLFYVCMTRAEDQLILTSRPLKKNDDLFIENPVSRFITEAIGLS
jgi:superfamily I DNA/RNA helicase